MKLQLSGTTLLVEHGRLWTERFDEHPSCQVKAERPEVPLPGLVEMLTG